MVIDKILPRDDRVSHCEASVNGHKYHYLLSLPKDGRFNATIFLIHGWPDFSFGWRYQIPLLTAEGLRVVVPDMMGYGGTDAPEVPPADLRLYSLKKAADDIAELARQLEAPQIILGGHDWGGLIVYRTAQWYPELITHVFSVCTPYTPPMDQYISTADLVKGPLPQFGYQLQLAGPDAEANIITREQVQQFLKGMYGGKTDRDQSMFWPDSGINFEDMMTVGAPPLMNENELEYYTDEYMRHGLHGPLNWYRTREVNFQEELQLKSKRVEQPVLFIAGTKDAVLKPEMSHGMEAFIPNLRRGEVESGHWALTQTPGPVNDLVKKWLDEVVFKPKSTL